MTFVWKPSDAIQNRKVVIRGVVEFDGAHAYVWDDTGKVLNEDRSSLGLSDVLFDMRDKRVRIEIQVIQ